MNKQAKIKSLEDRIAALETRLTKTASEHTAALNYNPASANGPYGRVGPVNPKVFEKYERNLDNAFKAYRDLLKKHGFDKVQYNHNFDRKLERAHDQWADTNKDIDELVAADWARHLDEWWGD